MCNSECANRDYNHLFWSKLLSCRIGAARSNFRFNHFFSKKRVKTFICRCVFDLVVCGLFKSCFVVYRWPRIRRSQLVEIGKTKKLWRLGFKIVEVKISDKKWWIGVYIIIMSKMHGIVFYQGALFYLRIICNDIVLQYIKKTWIKWILNRSIKSAGLMHKLQIMATTLHTPRKPPLCKGLGFCIFIIKIIYLAPSSKWHQGRSVKCRK